VLAASAHGRGDFAGGGGGARRERQAVPVQRDRAGGQVSKLADPLRNEP
jgi:hypothetical protein